MTFRDEQQVRAAARPLESTATGLGPIPSLGPPALVTLATVLALECMRVLFSVAYHTGESVGWTKTGLMVVVLFAVPALGAPLRRVIPPRILLAATVTVAAIGRVVLQFAGDITFGLAMGAAGLALLALALAVIGVHRSRAEGRLVAAVAVAVAVAVDVVVRATDATWDIVWRHDGVAWALTAVLLVGVMSALVASLRVEAVPAGERHGDGLASFVIWPYLYLVVFYVQSPAFVDSSGGVTLAVGTAVALVDATLAVSVLVLASRRPLPTWVSVAVAVGLAGVVYLLPGGSGTGVIILCGIVQVGAAALVGRAVGAEGGTGSDGIMRSSLGFAGGSVLFAAAALAYTLHTIQPLPFTNRFVPAAVALSLGLVALASTERGGAGRPTVSRSMAGVVGTLLILSVVVPVIVAATWPPADSVAVANAPLRVMSFNIGQGVTLGQLDLEQIAQVVEIVQPDVVVMEEVGRGWSVSGMTDEAEWFSRRLRMDDVWGAAADNQFGNLVLSRVPVSEHDVLALGKGNGTQNRSAVFVTVDLGGGREALVIGTHLQNGNAPPIHETRAQAYRDILDRWNGRDMTVFIGDLNTYPRQVPPGWPELNLVLDAGFATTQNLDQCTMPTSNDNCPDWIFVSPDQQMSPVAIVIDRPDHRPITATITPP